MNRIKKYILRKLGVQALLEAAYKEGWDMSKDSYYVINNGVRHQFPTWKSPQEGWVNSDAEEVLT